MSILTTQAELDAFLDGLKGGAYLLLDTEFMRDKSYYPKLCLVQLGRPDGEVAALDPFIDELDWQRFYDLLVDEQIMKVFHAGKQDIEIFYHLTGQIVTPVFDTQIAAMVCGYGDSAGFNNLVKAVTGKGLDKSAQFTDWSKRPLSDEQLQYALNDVIYLHDIYEHLAAEIARRGREHWVYEEEEALLDPASHETRDDKAWQRIKLKSQSPRAYAVLREVAAWREAEAKRRDVPRGRILRDDTLIDLAQNAPDSQNGLAKIRNMPDHIPGGKHGRALIEAIERANTLPKNQCPKPPKKTQKLDKTLAPTLEMLKMLLRIKAEHNEVAARLIASAEELEQLAADDKAGIPAMKGWRYEVFGRYALDLKHGRLAITLEDGEIHLFQNVQDNQGEDRLKTGHYDTASSDVIF